MKMLGPFLFINVIFVFSALGSSDFLVLRSNVPIVLNVESVEGVDDVTLRTNSLSTYLEINEQSVDNQKRYVVIRHN